MGTGREEPTARGEPGAVHEPAEKTEAQAPVAQRPPEVHALPSLYLAQNEFRTFHRQPLNDEITATGCQTADPRKKDTHHSHLPRTLRQQVALRFVCHWP